MTEHALTRARAEAHELQRIPLYPVIGEDRAADGVALVHVKGEDAILARFRDDIAGMWRVSGATGTMLVVVFARALVVKAEDAQGALRLIRTGSDEWSSFEMEGAGNRRTWANALPSRGRLRLWWHGQDELIQLSDEQQEPIERLWPRAEIIVHRPMRSHAASPTKASAPAALAVHHTKLENGMDKLPDLMRQTDKSLARRNEAHALSGILAGALRLFGTLLGGFRGSSPGTPRSTAGAAREERPSEPGIFSRLMGWMRWNTPLSAPLKNALQRRIEIVERLIRTGAVDEALRLALKLGAQNGQGRSRTLFPNRLPDARASLDFSVDRSRWSMPILAGPSFYDLRARYVDLARELAGRGDFRRSAYISSQLLGDHALAVRTLEQGGLLAEAAKLAHESGQHPSIVIRLLFKMGDHDGALAIAKRAACFEVLASESRREDPELHAFVLRAWTDELIATDQFRRALEVTDEAAEGAKGDRATGLLTARRAWLSRALSMRSGETFDADLVARALLSARWNEDDIPERVVKSFPDAPPGEGSEPFVGCLRDLQAIVAAPAIEARPALMALLRALVVHADQTSSEQAGFWAGPAARILEPFARATIEKASDALRREDIDDLRTLLLKASASVLAEDVRKLRSIYQSGAITTGAFIAAPEDGAGRERVICASMFANGQILLARGPGLIELLSRRGEQLWTGWLEDVVAIIAVGESRNAIIVQDDGRGAVRLARFSGTDAALTAIGALALRSWHEMTSESQWLVQIDGEVGALDLPALMEAHPRIVFLWSMQITNRLIVRCFNHDPLSPSWITLDLSPERQGVQEAWLLWQMRDLRTRLLTGGSARTYHASGAMGAEPLAFGLWSFQARQGFSTVTSLDPALNGTSMHLVDWSDAAETSLRSLSRRRADQFPGAIDSFQSDDFGRAHVLRPTPHNDGVETIVRSPDGARSFSLKGAAGLQLSLLTRAPLRSSDGGRVQAALFTDAFGRLHRLDLAAGVLLTLS